MDGGQAQILVLMTRLKKGLNSIIILGAWPFGITAIAVCLMGFN
jgi:hypothetical protein